MELSVRDWMIIVGVLLIVAVLLDGYRRVRNERRGHIRMSLNKRFVNVAGAADGTGTGADSCELPNGGARVVGRADNQYGSADHDGPDSAESDLFDGNIDLGLDQTVPMLMESVIASQSTPDPLMDPPPPSTEAQTESLQSSSRHAAETAHAAVSGDREVMVINVVAKGEEFKGPDLLHILLACDLRFGDMNIFHRYESANGVGSVQFSVANSVEPGTFDLDKIDDFSTPGVCFFMSVPGPEEPMQAFDFMVETAQVLVKNLDGEMRDESRSAMTMQTLEHCRQRLRDFERRQLTQHV